MAVVAMALALAGILAYALLRSDPFAGQPSATGGAAPAAPVEGARLREDDGPPPAVSRPAPPPVVEPAPVVPAPAAEPPAAPPAVVVVPPPVAAPEREPAAPARPRRTAATVEKGVGAVEVAEGMNVLQVPDAASGQGILTITANPWATVFLDGKELGETPREARVRAGAYKVRLAHPTLGTREAWVVAPAGKRKVHNVNLSR